MADDHPDYNVYYDALGPHCSHCDAVNHHLGDEIRSVGQYECWACGTDLRKQTGEAS